MVVAPDVVTVGFKTPDPDLADRALDTREDENVDPLRDPSDELWLRHEPCPVAGHPRSYALRASIALAMASRSPSLSGVAHQ